MTIARITKVLLSAKVSPDDPELAIEQLKSLRYPVMMSPKIDGIRAYIDDNVLSRKNKLIPNGFVQEYLKNCNLNSFDGELVVGSPFSKSCFNTTQSGVMSQDGEPQFRYFVFDQVDPTGRMTFEERFNSLQSRFPKLSFQHKRVILVPHRYAYSYEEVLAFEIKMVTQGWEGIMLRDPDGIYKQGRSTLREQILIKVKRFIDGEATVIGAYEQETNMNPATINEVGRSKRSSHKENKIPNGHLGGFYVKDLRTGVEFDVGTFDGFTKENRRTMWLEFISNPDKYLNKIIRYKYFPVGVKNKPRHPILTGFRSPLDL